MRRRRLFFRRPWGRAHYLGSLIFLIVLCGGLYLCRLAWLAR